MTRAKSPAVTARSAKPKKQRTASAKTGTNSASAADAGLKAMSPRPHYGRPMTLLEAALQTRAKLYVAHQRVKR